MPRVGQIIPEYLVPHVKTYINDNTAFVEEVTATDPSIRFLCVFASDKGDAKHVKLIDSTTKFIEEYGVPNYEKYGQAPYMPYTSLATGNAKCWCLRVADLEHATQANVIVYAETTKVEATGDTPAELKVKFTTKTIDTIVGNLDNPENVLKTAMLEDASETKIPLFAIAVNGVGTYGNSYGIRIVKDNTTTTNTGYCMYTLELFDKSSGAVVVKEHFTVCFDLAVITGTTTLYYASDVINDPEKGSHTISLITNDDGFTKLYAAYKETVADVEIEPFTACDLLYGTKAGTNFNLTGYTVVTEADSANFSSATGLAFAGGSDGRFDPAYEYEVEDETTGTKTIKKLTAEERQKVITDAFVKVLTKPERLYNAPVPEIFSKRRTPAEFILDAAFPCAIKNKLAELAIHRYDAQLVLDAGINLTTPDAIRNYAASTGTDEINGYAQHSDFIISKECQHYSTKDPFNQKIIEVSYTYYLAKALANHYIGVGNHVPMVGETYALLDNQIKNSIRPEIDADDLETKDELYKLGVNFVESIGENRYVHATQITAQSAHVWSDLSETSNVSVLLEMKRLLEEYVSSRLYNFADPQDRTKFTEGAERILGDYAPTKIQSYSVYFDMNEFETERSIIHCYLAVTFRQLAKRGIIEIDINKRV